MNHPGAFKTLTLVSAGSGLPELQELRRREDADEMPRSSLFRRMLNADVLDEYYLNRVPPGRALLYSRVPTGVAQILEAFRVRREYSAIISWAEHLGIPLAGLFRIARYRPAHVALFSWISRRKKAMLLRRLHHHIDRIILWSSVQKEFAVSRLGISESKIAFVRYPVDDKFWRPLGSVQSDMICSAGREMRDYETLIRALSGTSIPCHVAARHYPGKADPWRGFLSDARGFPPHISIGTKAPRDLRELYARSKFVVIPLLPTDTDNGVTCILEAMAMGKAVICSRVSGQRDVIREGETGMFVPAQDPRALREAVEYLWENPAVAERMGAEGRRHIERHHSLDAWVATVRGIVEEAIRERQPCAGSEAA